MSNPFSGSSWQAEYGRLRGLEAAYDRPTLRVLDELGIAPGWRCLEVGAGAGSIAMGMQLRAGSVIALDSDTRFVRHLSSPSFEVIEGTVDDAELPPDLDLVHARFLLDLVPDPLATISRLYGCLRPGGWLVFEEFDDLTIEVAWGENVASQQHMEVVGAKQRTWAARGLDNHLGRKLPDWFLRLGLTEVESQCSCRVRISGTADVVGWSQSLENMWQDLNSNGMSDESFGDYMHALRTPGFSYFSPLVVRAFGRKPPREL